MRIAHIDTERTWRGGEQQVLSLVDGLSRRGWDGVAVGRPGTPFMDRLGALIPVVPASPFTEWDPFAAARLRADLIRLGVDAVHAHTGHAVALGALATRGTRIPMVVTRRVDFPIGRNPLSRWKYGRAARIVAISDGVRSVLRADGVPPERIELVRSGVDFRRYDDLPVVSRASLGLPADALVVGQVAALAPHKDQDTFLAAIAELRRRHANVVGVLVGGGKLWDALERSAERLQLGSGIRFLGHRDDALSVMKNFDVFCVSSWAEGLGTSIIDAMALGVPVAATRVGGIPELVEEGVTGFGASARDPRALASAVEKWFSAPQRAAMLTAASQRAREFSIEKTIEGMERVYRSLGA